MVPRVVVQHADAELVEPVVEFLVDGVQADYAAQRKPDGELEEEVRVPEEGFVDVEASAGGVGGAGREGEVGAPDGEGDVAAAVVVAG